jgi:hypothetical protein
MAKPAHDDEEDKPLDPNVERIRRRLVRFMLVNFGLLFIALMVVAGAIVYKVSHKSPALTSSQAGTVPAPSEAAPIEAYIALPAGARLLSQSISENRISVYAELSDASHAILVYDMADGHLVGRYAVVNR